MEDIRTCVFNELFMFMSWVLYTNIKQSDGCLCLVKLLKENKTKVGSASYWRLMMFYLWRCVRRLFCLRGRWKCVLRDVTHVRSVPKVLEANVYSLKVFLAKIIFFLCFFLNSKVKNMCILFVLTIMRISVYLYWEHEESGSLRITVW